LIGQDVSVLFILGEGSDDTLSRRGFQCHAGRNGTYEYLPLGTTTIPPYYARHDGLQFAPSCPFINPVENLDMTDGELRMIRLGGKRKKKS